MRSEVTKAVVASMMKKNDTVGGDDIKYIKTISQSAIEQRRE